MKKFTIDERIWLHGEGDAENNPGESEGMLYRQSDEKQCCLGIFGTACGIDKEQMEGVGTPASLFAWHWYEDDPIPQEMRWLVTKESGRGQDYTNSKDARFLMRINDADDISDDERKKLITQMFAKHGIEVEFINGDVIQEAQGPVEVMDDRHLQECVSV